MTANISQVRAAQPERLTDAAGHAGQSADAVQQQLAAQRQALASMRNGWEGEASDTASANAERALVRQEQLVGALQRMQTALSSGGDQLSATRRTIVENVDRMEQVGYQVADDGTVTIKPGSRLAQLAQLSPASAMEIQAIAASNSLQLKTELAYFTAQDTAVAEELGAATAELNATQGQGVVRAAGFSQAGPSGWEWDDDDENNDIDPGPDPGGAQAGPGAIGPVPISLV